MAKFLPDSPIRFNSKRTQDITLLKTFILIQSIINKSVEVPLCHRCTWQEPCAIQLVTVWTMSHLLSQPESTPSILFLCIDCFQNQMTTVLYPQRKLKTVGSGIPGSVPLLNPRSRGIKPQRMANCPPLKSCCSLCLASLLSFTIATALATPVRQQQQTLELTLNLNSCIWLVLLYLDTQV